MRDLLLFHSRRQISTSSTILIYCYPRFALPDNRISLQLFATFDSQRNNCDTGFRLASSFLQGHSALEICYHMDTSLHRNRACDNTIENPEHSNDYSLPSRHIRLQDETFLSHCPMIYYRLPSSVSFNSDRFSVVIAPIHILELLLWNYQNILTSPF